MSKEDVLSHSFALLPVQVNFGLKFPNSSEFSVVTLFWLCRLIYIERKGCPGGVGCKRTLFSMNSGPTSGKRIFESLEFNYYSEKHAPTPPHSSDPNPRT